MLCAIRAQCRAWVEGPSLIEQTGTYTFTARQAQSAAPIPYQWSTGETTATIQRQVDVTNATLEYTLALTVTITDLVSGRQKTVTKYVTVRQHSAGAQRASKDSYCAKCNCSCSCRGPDRGWHPEHAIDRSPEPSLVDRTRPRKSFSSSVGSPGPDNAVIGDCCISELAIESRSQRRVGSPHRWRCRRTHLR